MTDVWDGLPENPESDGWHWLRERTDGLDRVWQWSPGLWTSPYGGGIYTPRTVSRSAIYLGPCLTPDDVAVKVAAARLDERGAARAALDSAARVLHKAGEQFAFYADQHAAKATSDGDQKAATNQQWAQRCFNAHDAALGGAGGMSAMAEREAWKANVQAHAAAMRMIREKP